MSNPSQSENPVSSSGRILFLPWVTLPHSVLVGGFRFSPIQIADTASVVGHEIAETVTKVLRCYIDRRGKPIESCTVVLRSRHARSWDIPERLWADARSAVELLALACLAEQRFLEGHFSPHLNATMFRLVGQGIVSGSDGVSLLIPRRGSGLRIGGLKFSDVRFQEPMQIEGTSCKSINSRLAKALARAKNRNSPTWNAISSSLELFLLGHSETQELGWETCIMLSAMVFERLLEPPKGTALLTAAAFANLWSAHATKTIAAARRIRPDRKPDYARDQQCWPLHRKWMKELYEARSSLAHRGNLADFSRNWTYEQHLVIAAFSYPLAVKLRLAAEGLYHLDDRELAACDALDHLLDSDWGQGWRKPPEWPSVLSEWETRRAIEKAIRDELSNE